MSERQEQYITTENAFEYKMLLRLRQLRNSRARVLIDLDSEELQVLGRIESLNRKSMSATLPIASVIFDG